MADSPGTGWQPTTPAMLHMVAGLTAPRLRAAFADAGLDGIRPAQAVVLVPLALGPLHASMLATHLGVTRQAVAQAIRALEPHGYVTRHRDGADARTLLIELTPRGRRALTVMRANALEIEADWRRLLGEQRLTELRDTLQLLLTDSAQQPG
ncbi:MarR family winged helix-turn-helix transcriptional regulator [Mycobacterium sp. OTB74]|uniref:MarR family winged helix-turn-helix transcriptional regulator n=1 Tax=Mycobacterium sp. OTB74 TaxID=1853452 RepID=UPI00247579BF|nr:MarR family winged helix-turn-helix transcriptional regulator [Mycobacterium sp. OTB74]MDH6247627.1 DNA-binding MarR family transcriptional regulator [Mycobacterium sp. OTB74]